MTDIASGLPAQRKGDDEAQAPATGPAAAAEEAAPSAGTSDESATPEPSAAASATEPPAVAESAAAEEAGVQAGDAIERVVAASGRVASAVVDRLRNNAELVADRGTTTIADEVVEKITGIAAREVPGVYELGGDVARVIAAVRERVGLGDREEDADRGVRVRLEGGTAAIDITLVIEYGFVVHPVTEKVRTNVINAVESLLGLEVTAVDITVDDVHVGDAEADDAGDDARSDEE